MHDAVLGRDIGKGSPPELPRVDDGVLAVHISGGTRAWRSMQFVLYYFM